MKLIFLSVCVFFGSLQTPLAYADTSIIIVLQGEITAQDLGKFSCRGINRSLATIEPLHFGRGVFVNDEFGAEKKAKLAELLFVRAAGSRLFRAKVIWPRNSQNIST